MDYTGSAGRAGFVVDIHTSITMAPIRGEYFPSEFFLSEYIQCPR